MILYNYKESLSKRIRLIDCIIDEDDKVWPMVAPGKPINDIMMPDEK